MDLQYIDYLLYVAMCLDLFFKTRKYHKVKKKMPHWKRYQHNATKLKYVLYTIILLLSCFVMGYRTYTLVIGQPWQFPTICLLIPLIDYYVIWDWFLNGIYYNSKSIYYKSEFYEFRRAVHIYRYLVNDHYEYDMTYRHKEGGLQEVLIKVPNEKEAFGLLAAIPFEEEDER